MKYDTNFLRSSSVSGSTAQINKLCGVNPIDFSSVLGHESELRQLGLIDTRVQLVYYVQLVSGCRISEVLSIQLRDIGSNGFLLIKGLKKSKERLIHLSACSRFLLKCKEIGYNPFSQLDRFYVYRCYKRANIGSVYGTNINSSVTHSARHEFGLGVKELTNSSQKISEHLGHRNYNNGKYYGTSKKG